MQHVAQRKHIIENAQLTPQVVQRGQHGSRRLTSKTKRFQKFMGWMTDGEFLFEAHCIQAIMQHVLRPMAADIKADHMLDLSQLVGVQGKHEAWLESVQSLKTALSDPAGSAFQAALAQDYEDVAKRTQLIKELLDRLEGEMKKRFTDTFMDAR